MDEEHFVTYDLLSLIAGSVSPSRDPEAETSNWEQASPASYVPLASTNRDSSFALPGLSRGARGICLARLPLPRKGTSSTPRVSKIKKKGTNRGKNAPEAQGEDFIPWVRLEPNWPSTSEEEDEEEYMMGLLDRYAARKRKRQEDAEREADRVKG